LADLAVLFLVWLVRNNVTGLLRRLSPPRNDKLVILTIIFLGIGALSLLVADNVWIGIKKLLFLINIFLLYIIIKNLAVKNKEAIFKIMGAMKVAIGLILAIGFVQLLTVFFVPLHTFWQFWAKQVIPVFYGQALSHLLSYSNTWFSYYAYQPPTLRMFSVFPDSHSFVFFCILSLPFFLTMIFLRPKKNKEKGVIFYLLLIICLLAIVFSGSRGAWVSALGSLIVFCFFILFYYSPTIRSWTDFFAPQSVKKWGKEIQLILGCLIIFFLLFPISSGILLFSQKAQLEQPLDMEKVSFFERVKSITDVTELSAKDRLGIWRRTIDSIIAHPFLGVGIGNYPIVLGEEMSSAKKGASAHNLYLDITSEVGIFGLLILLAIFWQIFKDSWLIFSRANPSFFQAWAGFFVLALIWIFGYSLFDVVLLNDKVLLFFIANLGLLYAAKHATKSSLSFHKPSHL
jgi:O-antigen ligase